jgi:hypothetical protein
MWHAVDIWTVILLTVLVTPARAKSSVNIFCGINGTTLCRPGVFLLPAVRKKKLQYLTAF